MEEYRLDIKVRNNVILYKIEQAGYKTLGEFLRLNNLEKYNSIVGAIINMKESPLNFKGEFKSCIVVVAELLGCDPLDLFTDTQLHAILKTNKRVIKVNEAEMKFLMDQSNKVKLLDDIILEDQRDKKINDLLDTLTIREKKIIQMRMGLGEYGREHTLEECGKELGITGPRVRMIEAKALRKMRHPSRADQIREFLPSEQ